LQPICNRGLIKTGLSSFIRREIEDMKLSRNWLSRYIDLPMSDDKLSEILTTIGLEVEGIEQIESVKGGLAGIVVGRVLTCGKHPGADKLSVTTVDLGNGDTPVQIVCGAPNVTAGINVLVATVGTTLYGEDGKAFKIKKGKIRGEASLGMICAEDELGLGQRSDGIMILPGDVPAGTLGSDFIDLDNDTVYDIGLTPNRSDATFHIGSARDVASYLTFHSGEIVDVKMPDTSAFKTENTTLEFEVEVIDKVACPRYSGITISNVKMGPSPGWMQKYLNAIDVKPINVIVDITNFVLHEMGQPLHAFDADKIPSKKIVVKKLAEGTEFKALDESTRKLNADDLMICDGNGNGLCIAGVFGGLESGVTDETANIFLESAHFNAGNIRRTSTRHLLRTDAAKVYEKGSDPNVTVAALKRAAQLMVELAGGIITSKIIDEYPTEIKPVEIHLKYQKVTDMFGVELPKDEIHSILRAMNMKMSSVGDDSIKVMVPTDKADVTRDVDLVEELMRIYGFNKIPIPTKVQSTISYKEHPDRVAVRNLLSNHLAAQGFYEMMGLSLIESKHYVHQTEIDNSEFVYINNTSNIHLDIMRPEMMRSGLLSVLHNHNRQQLDVRLFELGKSYRSVNEDFKETEYLTLFMSGKRYGESWMVNAKEPVDYFDIKRYVHSVCSRLGIQKYQVSELENDSRFQYGLSYHRGKDEIVRFGAVQGEISDKMGLKTNTYYAEFNMDMIIKTLAKGIKVIEPSKFPNSRRDLAVVVDKSIGFADLKKMARSADKKLLKEINLFDVYIDEDRLGKAKKSYAISYMFEDATKTLKDKDVDKIMNKIMNSYEHQLSAEIRR